MEARGSRSDGRLTPRVDSAVGSDVGLGKEITKQTDATNKKQASP